MLLFCCERCYRQSKEALNSAGCLWAPACKLIHSLVQVEKLDSTPYEKLVKIVKNHQDLKLSVTMQRCKFNMHEGHGQIDRNICHSAEGASSTL